MHGATIGGTNCTGTWRQIGEGNRGTKREGNPLAVALAHHICYSVIANTVGDMPDLSRSNRHTGNLPLHSYCCENTGNNTVSGTLNYESRREHQRRCYIVIT